jgi:glycerol-3-phosphate dehydrogenase
MLSREQRINHLRQIPQVSVLIVGAGINGIGVFRDLALQGLDVLLIDRGDYSSGASAATSHMVHGGIRYLENGEFRLVREAVHERNRLLENAPHLVKPLPTTYPIFKLFSGLLNAPLKFLGLLDKPAERGAVVIKVGMTLYDLYTRGQGTVPPHKFMNRSQSLQHFPDLNPDILFTGTYYDAAMLSPERIAVEVVLDAAQIHQNAIALNYISLLSTQDGWVTLRDELSGQQLVVQPKVVINAGGPWIDSINAALSEKTDFIGGTKGSHLVLDHPELRRAIGDHEFFFENVDGRIVLIFPLGERVLVGTSDIRIDDPDQAAVTDDEIAYFFDMVKRVFPSIAVHPSHIVFTFSGVRPLTQSESGSTAQISRDHEIKQTRSIGKRGFPVYSLVGGKWTTFRALAEQIADQVLETLRLTRHVSTRELPIGGGKGYPKQAAEQEEWIARLAQETGLSAERAELLFRRYGTRAADIAAQAGPDGDAALAAYPDYSVGEIAFLARSEDVIHLDDFLLRRSMLGMLGRSSEEGLRELGSVLANALGWNEKKIGQEVQRTRDILQSKHRMDFARYMGD